MLFDHTTQKFKLKLYIYFNLFNTGYMDNSMYIMSFLLSVTRGLHTIYGDFSHELLTVNRTSPELLIRDGRSKQNMKCNFYRAYFSVVNMTSSVSCVFWEV